MFKDKLQEYNELFDKAKKIEYEYVRKYEEESKPFHQKMEQIKRESDEKLDNLANCQKELTTLNSLFDNRKILKFFGLVKLYKENLINDTREILDKAKHINECFPTEQEKKLEEKCNKIINAAGSIKNHFEIKHANVIFWASVVLGIFFLIGAIQLLSVPGMTWAWIASGIFLALAVVLGVYYFIRNKFVKKELNGVYLSRSEIEQYTELIKNLIKEEAEKSKERFLKEIDGVQSKLNEIGDDLQAKQDNDLSGLKTQMHSYSTIDKAISNLISYYKEEIHWSSDYMKLFEQNFYLEINDEKDFLNACRDLIEKKKRDDEEKAEKRRREEERRRAQEEVERHNREMEYVQREQADALKKQQEEQRRAARSLCYSCKYDIGCGLKQNLSSPVCSKYQSKY